MSNVIWRKLSIWIVIFTTSYALEFLHRVDKKAATTDRMIYMPVYVFYMVDLLTKFIEKRM